MAKIRIDLDASDIGGLLLGGSQQITTSDGHEVLVQFNSGPDWEPEDEDK